MLHIVEKMLLFFQTFLVGSAANFGRGSYFAAGIFGAYGHFLCSDSGPIFKITSRLAVKIVDQIIKPRIDFGTKILKL